MKTTRINALRSSFFSLFLVAAMSSCATAPLPKEIKDNSLVLVDLLQKAVAKAAHNAPIRGGTQVAIVNLDGEGKEAVYPYPAVYDLLALSLMKKGLLVAERDAEGLYASVIESAADELPFYISPRCGAACAKGKKLRLSSDPKPGKERVTINGQPCTVSSLVEEKKSTVVGSSSDFSSMYKAPDNYRDLFNNGMMPWYGTNGKPLVTTQESAKLIVGYRLLHFGTIVEPASSDPVNKIRRVAQVDLVVKAFYAGSGNTFWAQRFKEKSSEDFDKKSEGFFRQGNHYTYYPPVVKNLHQEPPKANEDKPGKTAGPKAKLIESKIEKQTAAPCPQPCEDKCGCNSCGGCGGCGDCHANSSSGGGLLGGLTASSGETGDDKSEGPAAEPVIEVAGSEETANASEEKSWWANLLGLFGI